MFLGKGVLEICSKFTTKHPCRSVISNSIKLLCNCIEITLRHGCSPIKLLHIIKALFYKNTHEVLLRKMFGRVLNGSILSAENSLKVIYLIRKQNFQKKKHFSLTLLQIFNQNTEFYGIVDYFRPAGEKICFCYLALLNVNNELGRTRKT